MISFLMMRRRVVWCSCLIAFFYFEEMLSFVYYLLIYFQAVKGVFSTLSGIYLLSSILSQILFLILSDFLDMLGIH